MSLHELWIVALTESQSAPGQYAVILEETTSKLRIPLIIGVSEARAIGIAMENIKPPRPQTHDLLAAVIQSLGASVKQVVLKRIENETFFASLLLKTPQGELDLDARPSDALALAARLNSPIYATEEVLAGASFAAETAESIKILNAKTLEELESLLQSALANEDYEGAIRIREAIARRKSGGMS